MKLKLDAKTVAALALAKGCDEQFAWDAELEGFGLRLRRRAAGGLLRNWVTQYRAGGHTRRITIGAADKITPTQARDAARKLLARVELGRRPASGEGGQAPAGGAHVPRRGRDLPGGETAGAPSRILPRDEALSHRAVFPALQPLAINAITRADVATCVRAIARKHSVPTAAAARRALSALFAWAIADGLLGNSANPVDGSHRPDDPPPRDRVLADTELVAIWNACGEDDYGGSFDC